MSTILSWVLGALTKTSSISIWQRERTIHSGDVLIGDKNRMALLGHKFASLGYTTGLVNQRLSPAVGHPEHIRDIAQAFAWVRKNITHYGGDPQRVYVAGHSSGGYLAMLLATDPTYLAQHGEGPDALKCAGELRGAARRIGPTRRSMQH